MTAPPSASILALASAETEMPRTLIFFASLPPSTNLTASAACGIRPALASTETVTVSFDVTNTGARAGAAVSQLYLGNPSASVPRPLKELKGFARVVLSPGETRHVTLTLDPRAMSFFDVKGHAWKQEPGKFLVFVGHSSAEVDLQGEYTVAP